MLSQKKDKSHLVVKMSLKKRSVIISLLMSLYWMCFSHMVFSIPLKNKINQFNIEPSTLTIKFTSNELVQHINNGSTPKNVINLKQTNTMLSWYWPDQQTWVEVRLLDDDLRLTFNSNSSQELQWYSQPEQVSELALPLNEGMRVTVDNPQWRKYLSRSYSSVNSTYDFKMPFWSQTSGNKTFSWLLLDPFYNELNFKDVEQQIRISASHQFNQSNINQSFVVLLHVGDDLLSGARRYRRYLENTNQLDSLKNKFERYPEGNKMIGAIHAYLFGESLIDVKDVKNWRGLAAYLLDDKSNWLTKHFSKGPKKTLNDLKAKPTELYDYSKRVLVEAINSALEVVKPMPMNANNTDIIQHQYQALRLQKKLAIEKLSAFLNSPNNWGQGLSIPIIKQLKEAKLDNLWLGVNKWTAAFYHPEAVQLAKDFGYLVGTYDSYNTAIPMEVNESWLSAHLPDEMREKCALILKNGEKQTGFGKNGYYLNPNCQQHFVRKRISDILLLGKFNSYFIDVDATGMVRDDYNSENRTTQPQMTKDYNNRMQWIADSSSTVLGSEDGVSITQDSIIFAHGLETVGFGWQNKNMRKNIKSPYYLGRWYPDDKPDFFFKSAKVMEPFKTLLFSAEFRLPLYQAVYHDVVIASHHWTMDNLKFSDVQMSRDLIGMLYNTPPMINLSRNGANKRIKAIQHYQKGFAPIHQVLWDKRLVKFEYLNDNKRLQKTTFSDGSYIIANFSERIQVVGLHKIQPQSIIATLVNLEENKTPKLISWKSVKFTP